MSQAFCIIYDLEWAYLYCSTPGFDVAPYKSNKTLKWFHFMTTFAAPTQRGNFQYPSKIGSLARLLRWWFLWFWLLWWVQQAQVGLYYKTTWGYYNLSKGHQNLGVNRKGPLLSSLSELEHSQFLFSKVKYKYNWSKNRFLQVYV